MDRDVTKHGVSRSQRGFTFVELLVVFLIMGILAAMALPSFIQWRQGLTYRETARDLTSFLRNAKNNAIMNNRQQRVDIDAANRRYGIREGNRPNNSDWSVVPAVSIWSEVPLAVSLSATALTEGTLSYVVFNPNGTALASPDPTGITTITISNETAVPQFDITIMTSGRIAIARR